MVRGDLVQLAQSYLSQGYAPSQVKEGLLKQGWQDADVDEALAQVQAVPFKASRPWVAIGGVFITLLILGGISLYFFETRQPSLLLDVSLEPIKTDVAQGASLDFIIQLVNLGSAPRFDVHLKSELVSVASNEVVASKTETVAIETRNAIRSAIMVPADAKPGRYVLRTLAEYDGNSARASFSLRVLESQQVQQGLPSKENPPVVSECIGGCNDFDPCTKDSCVKGQCVFDKVSPCCGNKMCEPGESESTCPEDCQGSHPTIAQSVQVITDRAFGSASSDASAAIRLCKTLNQVSDQSSCFSGVSKRASQPDVCNLIVVEKDRDGCFLDFALGRERYDLCDKVVDRWLKSSCFSYANLKATGR